MQHNDIFMDLIKQNEDGYTRKDELLEFISAN